MTAEAMTPTEAAEIADRLLAHADLMPREAQAIRLLVRTAQDGPVREVEAVVRAITERGRAPHVHSDRLRHLRRDWPTLSAALHALVIVKRGAGAVPMEWR